MSFYFVQDIVFQIINDNGQRVANTFISTRHIRTNVLSNVCGSQLIAMWTGKTRKHIWKVER